MDQTSSSSSTTQTDPLDDSSSYPSEIYSSLLQTILREAAYEFTLANATKPTFFKQPFSNHLLEKDSQIANTEANVLKILERNRRTVEASSGFHPAMITNFHPPNIGLFTIKAEGEEKKGQDEGKVSPVTSSLPDATQKRKAITFPLTFPPQTDVYGQPFTKELTYLMRTDSKRNKAVFPNENYEGAGQDEDGVVKTAEVTATAGNNEEDAPFSNYIQRKDIICPNCRVINPSLTTTSTVAEIYAPNPGDLGEIAQTSATGRRITLPRFCQHLDKCMGYSKGVFMWPNWNIRSEGGESDSGSNSISPVNPNSVGESGSSTGGTPSRSNTPSDQTDGEMALALAQKFFGKSQGRKRIQTDRY